MQQHELLEFVLDAFAELATLHAAAAATADQAWSAVDNPIHQSIRTAPTSEMTWPDLPA